MICLSNLIGLYVFQMKTGKKIGITTGFAVHTGSHEIDALTLRTESGEQQFLKLNCVKSVGPFGLTIDQDDAFILDGISHFLLFDVATLRKVIAVDENGQFLGTLLDIEWLTQQSRVKSIILLDDQGEKVKIFYPNISVLGQDMLVLNVGFPNYEAQTQPLRSDFSSVSAGVEVKEQKDATLVSKTKEIKQNSKEKLQSKDKRNVRPQKNDQEKKMKNPANAKADTASAGKKEKQKVMKNMQQTVRAFQMTEFKDVSAPKTKQDIKDSFQNGVEPKQAIPKEHTTLQENLVKEVRSEEIADTIHKEFPELSPIEKGILEKQIQLLLNKRLTAPLFTSNGNLVFEAGTLLTLQRILSVQKMSPLLILDCAQNIEL